MGDAGDGMIQSSREPIPEYLPESIAKMIFR